MSSYTGPSVLIVYSNPGDTSRLRLDKEHRAIDQVLRNLNLQPNVVQRLHATSVDDFASALRRKNYDIVQFSGHGSEKGICLEGPDLRAGTVVSPQQVASLLTETSPNLMAAVFICCFSASSIPALIEVAPFLITVSGPADDETSINFVTEFYDSYFRDRSIEHAFGQAQSYLAFKAPDSRLNAILSRRAKEKLKNRVLFQVFPIWYPGYPAFHGDSILIDLTEAEADIESLGMSRDDFLSLLSRKIRIHLWIFDTPREEAILSIGPFFGLFSWQNAKDVVTCKKIIQVKPEVDEETCEAWTRLLVYYNDLHALHYRTNPNPADDSNRGMLRVARSNYERLYREHFADTKWASILRASVPEHFKVTKSLVHANLKICDQKYRQRDYASTVSYLEATLDAIHDLLDALTIKLTQ
jgi:hypothetical protein